MGKKNMTIELVRSICCVFVVFIHCPFSGGMGRLVTGLARIAVPFFLLVSGYFAYRTSSEDTMIYVRRKVKETLRLTGSLTVLYVLINTVCASVLSGNAVGWITPYCNWKALMELLCFNRAVFICDVMWYLLALLYVYAIFVVAVKTHMVRLLYMLIPVFLCVNIFLNEYLGVSWYYVGNFLLTGLPFFMLGHFLHRIQISQKITGGAWVLFGVAVGIVMTILEIFRNPWAYCYVGTIITVICIFVWCVQNEKVRIPEVFTRFSKRYSMLVFVLHGAVIDVLNVLPINSSNEVLSWLKPIIVVGITFVISLGVTHLGRWIKVKNDKRKITK